MKNFLILLLTILTLSTVKSQNVLRAGIDWREDSLQYEQTPKTLAPLTVACGGLFLSTGYPVSTNYWGGWMVRIINTNACPIVINSFEARFQGTAGYRIYTKAGTFVGFETTPAAWTLVGTVASLTGTSTTAPTAIPIVVNVTIPVGASQSFYLTRSDNLIANRHLYVTGTGVAGTTIYASNADLSITEGSYIDPYFAFLNVGSRRPSFDVCYTINCPLPIELVSFEGRNNGIYNTLNWACATETNNDFFTLERSIDGVNWILVSTIDGAGTSSVGTFYSYNDFSYTRETYNYYRLKQTDFNGDYEYSDIIYIDNRDMKKPVLIKTVNQFGQEVDTNYRGFVIEIYEDGSTRKIIRQ